MFKSARKYIRQTGIILIMLCLSLPIPTLAQSAEQKAGEQLKASGFENIRIVRAAPGIVCTIERGLYRSPVNDFRKALDLLKQLFPEDYSFRIILLEQGQAAYQLDATAENVNPDKTDTIPTAKSWKSLKVEYADLEFFKSIEKEPVYRPVSSGITLVLYPQLTLQNMYFNHIYEKQLNLAPTLNYSGWKGMLLTAQLIFPLVNEINWRDDYIRPGFLTFSQNFKLPNLNELKFTAGNFNRNRYGLDLRWKKHFNNSRWSLAANLSLTGYSSIYNQYWNHSALNQTCWNMKVSYYYPAYQLQGDLTAGQFLAGDRGARMDVYRHFGEVTIGVYAAYTGHNPNGGFHFALPLDPFRRKHRHRVRLMLPAYFDMEYSARNEFVYDRYYEIRPDENRSAQDIYPQFIQQQFHNP